MPKAAQHSPKFPSPPGAALWTGPAFPGELRAGRGVQVGIPPAAPVAQSRVAGGMQRTHRYVCTHNTGGAREAPMVAVSSSPPMVIPGQGTCSESKFDHGKFWPRNQRFCGEAQAHWPHPCCVQATGVGQRWCATPRPSGHSPDPTASPGIPKYASMGPALECWDPLVSPH